MTESSDVNKALDGSVKPIDNTESLENDKFLKIKICRFKIYTLHIYSLVIKNLFLKLKMLKSFFDYLGAFKIVVGFNGRSKASWIKKISNQRIYPENFSLWNVSFVHGVKLINSISSISCLLLLFCQISFILILFGIFTYLELLPPVFSSCPKESYPAPLIQKISII